MSQLILEAKQRIRQVRMKDVEVLVTHNGKTVPNAAVSLRMKNHQFLFGAVSYAHGTFQHPGKEERFTELFTKLFNYTMVPYHWSWYEPRRGEYKEPYTGNLVRWAAENGLKKKLHALIWHELCPDWVTDENVEEEYIRRIDHLMNRQVMLCGYLDCPRLVIHPGYLEYYEQLTDEETWDANIRLFSSLIPALKNTM